MLRLWCMLLAFCGIVKVILAKNVTVSTGQALVSAILDPAVSRITLDSDIRFEAEQWPATPYILKRNLTIDADPSGRHKVIDFNARAVTSKLAIGAGYNLSFVHLTLKDTRYGAGADIDLLAPSPNGILYLHDLAKLQHSCPPLVKEAILAYQRDATVPGVNKITFPDTVMWDGKQYQGNILYNDFSTRMAVGENLYDSGYVVHKRGSYKLCEKVVSADCAAASSAAACVRQDMDAEYYAKYPQHDAAQLSTAAKAGIGAAAGVVGAAILAAVAALSLRRRKVIQKHADLLPITVKEDSGSNGSASDKDVGPKIYKHFELNNSAQYPSGHVIVFGSDASSKASSAVRSCRPSSEGMSDSSSSKPVSPASRVFNTGSTLSRSIQACVPDIIRGTMTKEEAACISLGTMVGAGSFGRVFHGAMGDQEVAIKVINHSGQTAKQVANEVELMMTFDHPNLVKAHHYVTWGTSGVSLSLTRPELRDNVSSDALFPLSGQSPPSSQTSSSALSKLEVSRMVETWVISEYCNAGNLQDAVMLRSEGVFFRDKVPQMGIILRTLMGVSGAMEWLHNKNVLHGDLKCANVMLHLAGSDTSGGEECGSGDAADMMEIVPKVVDFGLSRVITQGATHLSTHTFGTITHQPPELMRNGRLSKQADVYSFGIMMWELMMAAQPWSGKMMGEIMNAVMIEGIRPEFGSRVPQAYTRLAKRCWEHDPLSRPTFAEISAQLQHLLNKEEQLQAEVDAAAA